MICFPLDNTEYSASALGSWLATRTRGVFSEDNNLCVTANNDMTITVSPGLAWLKKNDYWGVSVLIEQATALTIEAADGLLNRIDAVVLRLNKNSNQPELAIKQGAFASTPSVSPPKRDINYDEIYLATILISAGVTSITQADVTDQRLNNSFCGLMRDGVTGIPTSGLESQFNSWFATVKDTLSEDAAGNLLNITDANRADINKKVPISRKINEKQLAADIVLTASDVGAVPLSGGNMSGALIAGGTHDISAPQVCNIQFLVSDPTETLPFGTICMVYKE